MIKDLLEIIYKMFVLLASLVALKHTAIGETLFEKHYMPLVLAAVMVYFLLWIFYTLVSVHRTTITTLILISVLYGIVCAVSFAAFRIISPDTNFATFNLTLWLFTFIVIAFIYYQNQTVDDVATYGSEQPVVTAVQLTVNGGGNISVEQLGSVAVQPATTQQSLISSAKNA
jgi:ABC-type enterochelin transport system permease subunit